MQRIKLEENRKTFLTTLYILIPVTRRVKGYDLVILYYLFILPVTRRVKGYTDESSIPFYSSVTDITTENRNLNYGC